MIELIDTLEGLEGEDFFTIKNAIASWEAEVQSNASNYANDEERRLLSAGSICRYGTLIAMRGVSSPKLRPVEVRVNNNSVC